MSVTEALSKVRSVYLMHNTVYMYIYLTADFPCSLCCASGFTTVSFVAKQSHVRLWKPVLFTSAGNGGIVSEVDMLFLSIIHMLRQTHCFTLFQSKLRLALLQNSFNAQTHVPLTINRRITLLCYLTRTANGYFQTNYADTLETYLTYIGDIFDLQQ